MSAQVIQFSGAGAQPPAASIRRRDVGSVPPSAAIFQFPVNPRRNAKRDEMRARAAARFARRDAMVRFGKRLRVARAILGLSISDGAAIVGIVQSSWSNYESGARQMRTARFMRFVNHPTVKLRGFLLTWLLEDGAPADKEREIIAHCRSVGAASDEISAAICAIDRRF